MYMEEMGGYWRLIYVAHQPSEDHGLPVDCWPHGHMSGDRDDDHQSVKWRCVNSIYWRLMP